MKKIIAKYPFLNKVATLSIGNLIAQAIPFLLMPILTRLFTPSDFGVLALFVSLTGIISELVTGKYEMAILLPKNEIRALAIVNSTFLFSLILSLLTFICIFLFHDSIIAIIDNKQISYWLYFIPLGAFLNGIYEISKDYCLRKNKLRAISTSNVTRSSSGILIQIFSGLVKFAPGGLIIGNILSSLVANINVFAVVKREKSTYSKVRFRLKYYKNILLRYKDFPKFAMPSSILNSSSLQIIIIALSISFSSNIVGLYSLAQKVLNIPTSILGNSIRQVYYKEASDQWKNKESIRDFTWSLYKKLISIGVIPTIIILVLGPQIFHLVFGEKWIVAGQYAQILSVWFLLMFAASPISTLLIVMEKQKSVFLFQSISFALKGVVLILCFRLGLNAINTILLFSIISLILYQSFILYIFKTIGISLKKTILFTILVIICSILLSIILKYAFIK